MPSLKHEAPLEVIRQQPDVVADLLRRVLPQLRLPPRVTGALGSADMSQVAPAQYFADMVVVLSDQQTNKPVLAVVIEPQGRDRRPLPDDPRRCHQGHRPRNPRRPGLRPDRHRADRGQPRRHGRPHNDYPGSS